MSASEKLNILFLCTGNSCRSQMAEGWAKHLKGNLLNVYSAGIETHGLNPYAVEAMRLAEIDISTQQSTHIDEYKDTQLDYVITVCGHADEHCPVFEGTTRVIHQPFDDPPKLARQYENEDDKLAQYIRVRDEIRDYVKSLPDSLPA